MRRDPKDQMSDASSAMLFLKLDRLGNPPPLANAAIFADSSGVGKVQLMNFPLVRVLSCDPYSEMPLEQFEARHDPEDSPFFFAGRGR